MKSYIVYNSEGIIIRTGVCSQHDLPLQAVNGQFMIEGEADDASQIVVDGEIVDKPETIYTDAELKDQLLKRLRAKRRNKLAESDWTQLPDSPLSKAKKTKWSAYRQALRDIPETYADATSIDDIIWPTKPE